MRNFFTLILFLAASASFAQLADTTTKAPSSPKKDHWYDKLSYRGYTQIRYNRLLETNPDLKFDSDKSVGDKGGVLIRRGRIVLSGDVHPRMFVYIQTDFAVTSGTNLHYTGLRDAYFDVALDSAKNFRFRIGQSKVPFGFENMQSSSNRLPLERSDALNSATPGERDLGAAFMYTPKVVRERIKELNDKGLKHSGDYGMFVFGVYNGQSINKAEANNNLHVVSRISYPFAIKNQVFELGVQGYSGFYTMTSDQLTAGVKTNSTKTYRDERAAASFNLYPKPFGILAEYNVGYSPMYDVNTDSIINGKIEGGFITVCYMQQLKKYGKIITPFVRAQYFSGAKKIDTDARAYKVNEYEMGIEYLVFKNIEITAAYCISTRNTSDKAKEFNNQSGNLLRLQIQLNY
ncbi:MAG: OprO/OprP family phosphate-selective porin [Bacteroidia bacterium]